MSVPSSLLTPWLRLVIHKQRIFHPRRHLTILADIFHCHNLVGATGIWKVEARDLLNILHCIGQPVQQRIIWPKMSIVFRLRNPYIKSHHCPHRFIGFLLIPCLLLKPVVLLQITYHSQSSQVCTWLHSAGVSPSVRLHLFLPEPTLSHRTCHLCHKL